MNNIYHFLEHIIWLFGRFSIYFFFIFFVASFMFIDNKHHYIPIIILSDVVVVVLVCCCCYQGKYYDNFSFTEQKMENMNMEIINQFNEHIFLLFVKENPGFYFAGKSLNEMEIHKILFYFINQTKKGFYIMCVLN